MLAFRLRWTTAWLFPAVATAQVATPTVCRAPDGGIGSIGGTRRAGLVGDAVVRHREARREIVIEVGPLDLPAGTPDERDLPLAKAVARLPVSGWVHGYRLDLLDAGGTALPRSLLHHLDAARPGYRDLFVPEPQRLVIMGAETPEKTFPAWMVGVPVRAGETVVLGVRLRPVPGRSYHGVTARLTLPYTTRRPDVEVHGFRVDVMFPAGYVEFDLPPGRSVWTWEGSPGFAGRVYALAGHLHRYAESIVLEDVTAEKVLYRAEPGRAGARAEVIELPIKLLRWGRGYVVRPSHRYRLTATYVNPTPSTIAGGGMANVGGIFEALEPIPPLHKAAPSRGEALSCAEALPPVGQRAAASGGADRRMGP